MKIYTMLFTAPVILFFVFGILDAGTDIWTTGGPEGGHVMAVTADPTNPSTLYLGSAHGRLYKSTDSGLSWHASDSGLFGSIGVRRIVIDPFSNSVLYAALQSGGVFKSTDSGENWAPSSNGLAAEPYDLVADPATNGILYCVTHRNGVYKSTDGGANWFPINQGLFGDYYYALAMDSNDSSVLYLAGPGINKTTDGGASWFPAGMAERGVHAIAVDSMGVVYAKSLNVYSSGDGGTNWTQLTFDSGDSDDSLAIDSAGNIYAGLIGKIRKSTDHGASWIEYTGLPLYIRVIATDPANVNLVFAGAQVGFYFSSDGGAHWSASNSGFVDSNVGSVALDPMNPSVAYAGCSEEGLWKTIDGGSTWARISTGFVDDHIIQVAVDPTKGNKLYALPGYGGVSTEDQDQIIQSADAGKTWKRANKGLGSKRWQISWLVIDPVRPRILYAPNYNKLGRNAIFRTTNHASKWKELTSMESWQDLSPVAIDPLNHKVIYIGVDYMTDPVGCDYAIMKSTDSGIQWAKVYTGSTGLTFDCMFRSIVVDPSNDQIVYAAWERGILKSTNGGVDWVEKNNGLTRIDMMALVIDPVEPSTLYTASRAGVFKTTNGGDDWVEMNEGLLNLTVSSLALSPANHHLLYAATAGGVYVIEQTGTTPESLHALKAAASVQESTK